MPKTDKKIIRNSDFGTGLSTSDLSLVLSKKEEEWFFITSTLDGKMLHKLFFMRNATFENVTALLIQEHDPLEF